MDSETKVPKRYKKTSFYFCIALAVFYFFEFGIKITSVNIYDQDGWLGCLILAVVFSVSAVLLKRRNDAAAAACDRFEAERIETQHLLLERLRKEQEEKRAASIERQRQWEETHGKINTKLVGVTFENEDGTSRQKALKDAMANGCAGTLDLEAYDYKGEQAVRVLYEGIQIGFIPQSKAEEVAAVIDRISNADLHVERFMPDDIDAEPIYRADLSLIYLK